jgi:hypothetical protein
MKFQDLRREHMHHSNAADQLHQACDRRYTYGAFELRVSTEIWSSEGRMHVGIGHPNYGYVTDPFNNPMVPNEVLAIGLAIKRWHEDWVAGQKPELPIALGPIIESMGAGCPRCGR